MSLTLITALSQAAGLGCSSAPRSRRAAGSQQITSRTPSSRSLAARSAAASSAASFDDAGSAFLQQFKAISDLPKARTATPSSTGCCNEGGEGVAQAASTGCCGGSSASADAAPSAQSAATSVMQQLNGMMSGMQGSLSREDLRAGFEASKMGVSQDGGERFLDVVAILHSRGEGNDDDDDAELDALVV